MTNEPSPRPWRVEENAFGIYIVGADDRKAAQALTSKANAALIVDAVNERDRLVADEARYRTDNVRLRDIVRRLAEYADALTGYRPRTIEVLSSEHPAWTFDGAALLAEARAAIGEGETPTGKGVER